MTPKLTKMDALRAYARMMYHLSADHLEPFLADDFHYASQWVLDEITSKQGYLDYIRPKLKTIIRTNSKVWAEIGELTTYPGGPCLVMAQGDKGNLIATVLAEVSNGKIKRIPPFLSS